MKLDSIGRTLIKAAKIVEIERAVYPHNMHPVLAIRLASKHLAEHLACCKRLFIANGYDHMDMTQEENIDALVAAAFWEMP